MIKLRLALILCLILAAGCASKEHEAWLEDIRSAREQWHACAMNATSQYSRQYADPDMIARYALHLCEPNKKKFIEIQLKERTTDREKFFDGVEKDETRLRERMQMFAAKWMADREAQLDQGFPEPLVFK